MGVKRSAPFRYDQTLTDYGEGPIKMASTKLTNAQLDSRRAQQREYARNKRATDPAWVARRNAYMRKYRAKAPSSKEENPHDPRNPTPHGTPKCYANGCRRPTCTMAHRDAMRVYRTGDPGPEENLR